MKFFITAETDKTVGEKIRLAIIKIQKAIDLAIGDKTYGEGIVDWGYVAIAMTSNTYDAGFFKERKWFSTKTKEVDMRLWIDYDALLKADETETLRLISNSILRSIDLAQDELKIGKNPYHIKGFDFRAFRTDLIQLFAHEGWILNDTNETVSAIAMFLLDDTGSDLETPYKQYLSPEKLDYSLESLEYVDEYLVKIKKKVKLLTDEQFTKVILRCGAYCGEVIRKNSKVHFDWMTYDNVVKTFKQLDDFGKSGLTFYILTSNEGENLAFPMAKVEKFLNYGMQESLYSFALVFGEF